MTAAARKAAPKSQRAGLVQKVHVAKGQLALTEESYRDLLQRVTGHNSSTKCTVDQLEALLKEFGRLGWNPKRKRQPARAGKRPVADGEVQSKIHALWLALYHLGVVRNPEEAAIDAFVKRQAGVASLRFLPAERATKVIEALKSMAETQAGVRWPRPERVDANGLWRIQQGQPAPEARVQASAVMQKAAVIEAQWRLLARSGALRHGVLAHLDTWLLNNGYQAQGPEFLSPAECDRIVETLGRWLRRQLKDVGKTPKQLIEES